MNTPRINLQLENWTYRAPFKISRKTLHSQTLLYASVSNETHSCHGEGEPHESDLSVAQAMLDRGKKFVATLDRLPDRNDLRKMLPPDGLRNALDSMLWDHESKQRGIRAWELAEVEGLDENSRIPTMITISMSTPSAMAETAEALPSGAIIKVKLGDRNPRGLDMDIERIWAISERVNATGFIVDANEGWDLAKLQRFQQATAALPIIMYEQPLPATADHMLCGFNSPVAIAADESCASLADLPKTAQIYQCVNIKLDKCGGLTEALEMISWCKKSGIATMIGCNCGTSLSMASAFVAASLCDYVDLDGPLHLASDRKPAIQYDGKFLRASLPQLWG